jgi:type IV pilus assembly protein PilZ
MTESPILNYTINDPVELNLSYIPFINNGGLFVPTFQTFTMGDFVTVDLFLPGKKDAIRIEGKIVWITPQNALHHVLPGIGIQFIGPNAQAIRTQIEGHLDNSMEIGGYTYGMTEEGKTSK